MNEPPSSRSYRVQCVHCRVPFDAFEAMWCECVVHEPTIVCPSCMRCLCASSPSHRRSFWENAPKTLWEHRRRCFLRDQPDLPAQATAVEVAPAPEDRPVILVMDDSRVTRHMALQALAELDVRVVLAADGAEGLDLAMQLKPHVIVADALMPKLDGRVVCEAVKRNQSTRHTKVAIVTGLYTAPRYKTEAHRMFGADEYLVKPVQQEQLHAIVTRLLKEAEAELSIDIEIEDMEQVA